ncbi:DUF1489 domain-containing protein [Roseomonas sp. E05]|uniref:DUF1489 family protein n=1 Tax=Roseomonas sp. E05 TaxID=3046310 RepID=UPI0024BABAC7|nr:DUF1489 domain-containing protein [Roseomonas sp. E05]MDJ0386582.1 DUF1489 domain-containing protein [Roseomonas sp. E05]
MPPPLVAPARRRTSPAVLHLIKLCVGPRDVATLQAGQERRAQLDPPLRHLTRMAPKRAAEVLDGGSLYWVVAGFVCVRQRILDIRAEAAADGSARTALVLDAALVAVAGRPVKPFQGWRYLEAEAAPPDLAAPAEDASGIAALPPALRRELQLLALL